VAVERLSGDVEMAMTTMVQTVHGPVGLDQLGETMMHEHVFSDHREEWREQNLAVAKRELRELVDAGGQTLVDASPDPRRHISWYVELASQVDLNMILSTGFYLQRRTPEALWDLSEDECVERFAKELTQGVTGSGIRAAVIKVAGDKAELTPWELKGMRAAARVQRDTGVPICTHACEGARNQFDVLTEAGADPERIYLCHVEAEFGWEGRTLKEQAVYLEGIAHAGGTLFFNNFGFEFDTPHEDLMYLMHYLCDRGHEQRVMFGIDANFRFDDDGSVYWEAQKKHPEAAMRDFAYTYTGAIPVMRKWGFTDGQLRIFMVDNPKRMFSATRI
jgi:phosphotriesterase-related protein